MEGSNAPAYPHDVPLCAETCLVLTLPQSFGACAGILSPSFSTRITCLFSPMLCCCLASIPVGHFRTASSHHGHFNRTNRLSALPSSRCQNSHQASQSTQCCREPRNPSPLRAHDIFHYRSAAVPRDILHLGRSSASRLDSRQRTTDACALEL